MQYEVIRSLEFEVHFSLPGLLSLLPYCASHVCLYDIFVLTLAEIDVDSINGIPTRQYWYDYDYVSDIIAF